MVNFIKEKYLVIIFWAIVTLGFQYAIHKSFNLFDFIMTLIVCAMLELAKDKLLQNYMKKKVSDSNEN